jgi:hypothetical protein
MKKIGLNPRQLQLWKDWQLAKDEFDVAVIKLNKATVALVEGNAMTPKEAVKATDAAAEQVSAERKRLKKMVNILSRRKQVEWNLIYRSFWAKLMARVGYDAEAQAASRGIKPIAAIEQDGHLPLVMKIALEMA